MEQLSNKLNIIETKLKQLAKKLLELKHSNDSLQSENYELKEAQKELDALKSQNNKLMHANQTLVLMQEENAKLKAQQEQHGSLITELNQFKKAQQSFDNRFEQEKRKLKAVQNTNQQLLAENSKLRNVQKQSPNVLPAAATNINKVQELELENNRLKKQIEKDKGRVLELQEQLSQSFNSTSLHKTSPDSNRIRKEIDLYITEIDKCIELINE